MTSLGIGHAIRPPLAWRRCPSVDQLLAEWYASAQLVDEVLQEHDMVLRLRRFSTLRWRHHHHARK